MIYLYFLLGAKFYDIKNSLCPMLEKVYTQYWVYTHKGYINVKGKIFVE